MKKVFLSVLVIVIVFSGIVSAAENPEVVEEKGTMSMLLTSNNYSTGLAISGEIGIDDQLAGVGRIGTNYSRIGIKYESAAYDNLAYIGGIYFDDFIYFGVNSGAPLSEEVYGMMEFGITRAYDQLAVLYDFEGKYDFPDSDFNMRAGVMGVTQKDMVIKIGAGYDF